MGSELKMSTSFRPQNDGQQDWVDHLELAEFCYNNSEHSATGVTAFQMVTGKSPIVPTT
jgi:hypothetical protein